MGQVIQAGTINLAALTVPDAYINIVPPPPVINGIPTNILGIVGVASWGPVGSPVILGDPNMAAQAFGNPGVRKYDLVTAIMAANLQGANNFRGVRVTDGTDAAATIVAQTNCITFTGKYSGSTGNSIQINIGPGTKAGTYRVVVALPNQVPEAFDNLASGLTGNAIWVAIAAAINNGPSIQRGPSNLIVATAGAGTTTPTTTSYTLTGGADGASTATGTTLIGQDTVPRKGMYALRSTGASVAMLADCDDSTTWTTQVSFGLSEGVYMIGAGPSGDTIANAVSAKASAGIDSYAFKLLFGDWVYFNDTINGVLRLISPQAFNAGQLANLSPEQSSLNKQVYGVVATQKTYQNQQYSQAELSVLSTAGIDLITNPIPAGDQFGCRFGRNSSSQAAINGDNYTRMTNFLAYTFAKSMGIFVGQLQSDDPNDELRRTVKSTTDGFLQPMMPPASGGDLNMINSFLTICDLSNNPLPRIAAGYMQMDAKVKYLAVVQYFIVNLEGGQTVSIQRGPTQSA